MTALISLLSAPLNLLQVHLGSYRIRELSRRVNEARAKFAQAECAVVDMERRVAAAPAVQAQLAAFLEEKIASGASANVRSHLAEQLRKAAYEGSDEFAASLAEARHCFRQMKARLSKCEAYYAERRAEILFEISFLGWDLPQGV